MTLNRQTATTTEMGREIFARICRIAQIEARLLKAETSDNARRLVLAVVVMIFAILLAFVFLASLAGSMIFLLIAQGFSAPASAGLVAGGALAFALLAALWGGWLMRTCSVLPHRTVAALKDVVGALGDRHA